jgi:hypothetical protein
MRWGWQAPSWITDKPEGFTVNAAGEAFVVADNDGVDGRSGRPSSCDSGRWPTCSNARRAPEIPEASTPVLFGLIAIVGVGATWLIHRRRYAIMLTPVSEARRRSR